MSNSSSGDSRLSKNERREAARDKARRLREEQRKKERRTKILLQGGIVLASLAIVAIIGVVIATSVQPAGPGPKNMASDGIQVSQGELATETSAIASDATPVANERDTEAGVLDIQTYVDYLCPVCGTFEKTNGEFLSSLLENGKTTIEVHPVSFLDNLSQGTKYSTRAANALACVADSSPNEAYAFHNLMYENQPEEGSSGLTDDEIIDLTKQAEVENAGDVASCIQDKKFRSWVNASTDRATTGPIPNSDVDQISGTPTVIVNGKKYEGSPGDLAAFQAFVAQAAGTDFNDNSTPSPTPSAAP